MYVTFILWGQANSEVDSQMFEMNVVLRLFNDAV